MSEDLLRNIEPVNVPKAAYSPGCSLSFIQEQRRLLREHPEWLSMSSNDAMAETYRRPYLEERILLSLLCTEAAVREDAAEATAKRGAREPAFPESYMHVREEQPAPKAEVARYAPKLEQAMQHSPPCTTETVISIWDSYPELQSAGGLTPNSILAVRGTQLQFRRACEFVAKKMAGGLPIGNPAGMVHKTFKTHVGRP